MGKNKEIFAIYNEINKCYLSVSDLGNSSFLTTYSGDLCYAYFWPTKEAATNYLGLAYPHSIKEHKVIKLTIEEE